jgi:hypothetical protein
MEMSPSREATSRLATQEPPNLWNPKVHYHVHKNLPLVSVFNPVKLNMPLSLLVYILSNNSSIDKYLINLCDLSR